jgi:hypothetical protein
MRTLTASECRRVCPHLSDDVFDEVYRRTQGRMRDLFHALNLIDGFQKGNASKWKSLGELPVRAVQKFLNDHFLGSEA